MTETAKCSPPHPERDILRVYEFTSDPESQRIHFLSYRQHSSVAATISSHVQPRSAVTSYNQQWEAALINGRQPQSAVTSRNQQWEAALVSGRQPQSAGANQQVPISSAGQMPNDRCQSAGANQQYWTASSSGRQHSSVAGSKQQC